jgi:hypothetical protein
LAPVLHPEGADVHWIVETMHVKEVVGGQNLLEHRFETLALKLCFEMFIFVTQNL